MSKNKTQSRVRTFNITNYPEDFWEWLVLQKDFRTAISKQGFYELEKVEAAVAFKEWADEQRRRHYQLKIQPREYRISGSLSVDFYSQMPRVLHSNDLYTVPTGKGNCTIFDSNVFPAPFVKLNDLDWDAEELPVRIKKGFRNLVDSLSAHWNEQSFLRALHFSGVFAKVVKEICNSNRYECGPFGHIASCFPFWMKNKRHKLVRFVYEGIADLDECLYPRNANVVIPIEAKIDSGHTGLSWHKLAFPAYRFIDNSRAMRTFRTGSSINGIYNNKINIVPVYCLYNPTIKKAYIYVFSAIAKTKCLSDYPECGIVLNDKAQMVPKKVFEVRLDWI